MRTRNNLYMRLDLVGDELDQIDSIWGRTRHGVKPAATHMIITTISFFEKLCFQDVVRPQLHRSGLKSVFEKRVMADVGLPYTFRGVSRPSNVARPV